MDEVRVRVSLASELSTARGADDMLPPSEVKWPHVSLFGACCSSM